MGYQFPTALSQKYSETVSNVLRKAKAAIAAAEKSNAVINQPWLLPPALTALTAYGYSTAVTSGGNTYVNTNNVGVTTGAAPSLSGTGPFVVSDGTNTSWVYQRTNETAFPAYDAPGSTLTSISPGLALSVNSLSSSGPNTNLFNFVGGVPLQGVFNGVYIASVYQGSAGNLNGNVLNPAYNFYSQLGYARVEFMTDAPKIAISINGAQLSANTSPALAVDDRFVIRSAINVPSSLNPGYMLLDWTGSQAQGRRQRKIRLHLPAASNFGGVQIDALSQVWTVQNSNRYRIVFEGDSLTSGASAANTNAASFIPGNYWCEQVADLIGCDDFVVAGLGGTGLNNPGSFVPYIKRLPFIASLNPDVLFICGNTNDNSYTVAQNQAALTAYLSLARSLLPNAIIVVWGTWPANTSSGASTLALDVAASQSVAAFNDPLVVFYSIMTDGGRSAVGTNTFSWSTGTGYAASGHQVGDGNSDVYTSSGLPHPTQQGCDYMARRYANAFKSIINSLAS